MKKPTPRIAAALVLSGSLMGAYPGLSFSAETKDASPAQVAPDNSRMNQQDRSAAEPTADQAGNSKSDVEIMGQIRQDIVEDKSLSTYARNIKIIAEQGKVTLKGTVHTSGEKTKIGEKAAAVAGPENVTNKINVKGS